MTETATLANTYGTPNLASISAISGDKGTLKDHSSFQDIVTIGTGAIDVGDAISFDDWYQEEDTGTANLAITITTNGQV